MLGTIVQEMATLAQRLQVLGTIVGWIMVEVRGRQNDLGHRSVDRDLALETR